MNHVNAQDVFPAGMVEAVQKYYHGGYLWISRKAGGRRRDMKIRVFYKRGMSIARMAEKFHLTARRIRQIIGAVFQGKRS